MRILIFDCLQLETEKIKAVLSKNGFITFASSNEDVGEHLWFGQFNAILVAGNIEEEFKKRVFELAEEKQTKIIEIENNNNAIEEYIVEVVLPELQKI